MDSNAIYEAIHRDGGADPSRDERIDEVLSPQETVGFRKELPLLSVDYDEYLTGNDLFRPEAREQLEELVNHPLVGTVDHMKDELNSPVGKVEKALSIQGIEPPQGVDVRVEVGRAAQILGGGVPVDMLEPKNPVIVGALYVDYGLSVEEIGAVLDGDPATVKQTLVDCGLLEGESTDVAAHRRRQTRGEVNRPQVGGRGVTVDANDYE